MWQNCDRSRWEGGKARGGKLTETQQATSLLNWCLGFIGNYFMHLFLIITHWQLYASTQSANYSFHWALGFISLQNFHHSAHKKTLRRALLDLTKAGGLLVFLETSRLRSRSRHSGFMARSRSWRWEGPNRALISRPVLVIGLADGIKINERSSRLTLVSCSQLHKY